MSLGFVRSKKFYIPAIIVVILAGLVGYSRYKKAHQPPNYEMATVSKGDLVQRVEATGQIESVNALDLRFETPGTLAYVAVKEGDKVKAGTLLANLRLNQLNASVAQAQANLQLHLAGATSQDIAYYAAAVDAAKAALDQAKADATNPDNSLIATLPKLDDALTQADNILGVDNTQANADFKQFLSVTNPTAYNNAVIAYGSAKNKRDAARAAVQALPVNASAQTAAVAFPTVIDALTSVNSLLSQVGEVLDATVPNGSLTQAALDTKKSTIVASRTAITAQLTTVTASQQSIADSDTTVRIKQAAYDQAVANYQAKIVPPREVDVAPYRAALAAAIAARDQAVIRAPIDGVVTKVNKKVGELVTAADVPIQMLSPHFEVKVDVAETDVAKLKVSDPVDITLDAFGPDTKFTGTILSIDPASTEIQDVVYYQVTIGLNDTSQQIKAGMTANVSVTTDSRKDVLFIPLRAVRTAEDGSKYVRTLENNQEKTIPVTLGLKDSEGHVEVTNGLQEGESIIVSTRQ